MAMKYHAFYVTGSGVFPFDMLRYDACWPASSEDAAKIGEGLYNEGAERRTIKLNCWRERGLPMFTAARWASFMWSASEDKRF